VGCGIAKWGPKILEKVRFAPKPEALAQLVLMAFRTSRAGFALTEHHAVKAPSDEGVSGAE
jgi:hypothetical protein